MNLARFLATLSVVENPLIPAPAGEKPPEPMTPAAPASAQPSSSTHDKLKHAAEKARVVAKLRLVRARYVMGTLGTALLVSVPIDVGYQILHGRFDPIWVEAAGVSVLYGLLCFGVFGALVPVTRVEWRRMRVPEFQSFELRVSFSSMIVAAVLLILSLAGKLAFVDPLVHALLPRRLFWTVFVLMAIAWAKLRVQTWLFPEFYKDEGGERVLDIATELARIESPPKT